MAARSRCSRASEGRHGSSAGIGRLPRTPGFVLARPAGSRVLTLSVHVPTLTIDPAEVVFRCSPAAAHRYRWRVHGCTVVYMTDVDHRSIRDTRANLSEVVHNAAVRGRRTVITSNNRPAAVVMPLAEVEDLEDTAAYVEWRRAGSPTVGTLDDSALELGIVIPEPHGQAA
jgi:prevent-host-death family protein